MWTGYFTSRSALKRYIRINSAYLNAVRQLNVFGGGELGPDFEEAMGLGEK
jgi:alpha-mannosidase